MLILNRWYGGTLTNWKTISNTIKRLRTIEDLLDNDDLSGLTKKELLKLNREKEKLDTSIGGIKDMGGLPDLIFVLDTVKEQIAIQEATKLNIPIAAIIDSNSNPDGVTYPIPGNDDSTKSISLFCGLISKAALDGIAQSQNEISTNTETAPKVTKNKTVKTKDTKSNDDKAEDKEIKKKKSDKVKDSAVKKSEEKKEDKPKNPLSDEASVAQSDAIEVKALEISEKEEK